MSLTRRGFLVGGGAAIAAAIAGIELWPHGLPAGVPHETAELTNGSFTSRAMHRSVGWTIATPKVGDVNAIGVLIALHGRTGDHRSAFGGSLHLDRFLADAAAHGAPPFAIASVDGGDHSYWHPRRDSDAAAMVIDEFLPMLPTYGIDTKRLGFLGWSMGGYGALYLGERLGSSKVKVVIAESPAIWHEAGASASGAFDDADDWTAHDIWGNVDRLRGIALRIDCGASDGFAPVTRDLRAALTPTPAGGIEPGAHNAGYWRSQAPAQLRFAAQHLA